MSDNLQQNNLTPEQRGLIGRLIGFCLKNRLVVFLSTLLIAGLGLLVAPFDWQIEGVARYPIPVDAIPDIGENQQIVFTSWPGRSPQDVEDQVTYPLTVALQGLPQVKVVRSVSMFGFSSIYVIFNDNVDFYWSRSRVLEKLRSLQADTLPDDVRPVLGPDATPLGQIYWYTLQGRDADGNPAGGWDLEELRTLQDWYVRYWLQAAEGVSEVASVGGYQREYQIDVDPDAMRAYGVTLNDVYRAVKGSNLDVGARSVEINRVEYFIRGIGFIKDTSDIEDSVIRVNADNVPVVVSNVARVSLGPAERRGALDKGGSQAVGGVVVARYGSNPLAVIRNVKQRIEETRESLPTKAVVDFGQVDRRQVADYAAEHGFRAFADDRSMDHEAWLAHLRSQPREQWPAWVNTSTVTVVPFYDRTGLIYETLGTLNSALVQQVLICTIVVILMVMHLRSSILISGMLPLSILLTFIGMRLVGVDANVVSLAGIAIAIGTVVDVGIVIVENMLRHLSEAAPEESRLNVLHRAAAEHGGAVVTASLTTIIGFLPVFTLTAAEGKMFRPLAWTNTLASVASIIIALTILPAAAYVLFCIKHQDAKLRRHVLHGLLVAVGVVVGFLLSWWAGLALLFFGSFYIIRDILPQRAARWAPRLANLLAVAFVGILLSWYWEPLGVERGLLRNIIFVGGILGLLLGSAWLFQHYYTRILAWCLDHKAAFLSLPLAIAVAGLLIWLGPKMFLGPLDATPQMSDAQYQQASLLERGRYNWNRSVDRVIGGFKKDLAQIRNEPWADDSAPADRWISNRGIVARFKWTLARAWNGIGREFMPPLDEGSYLYMPTTMAHASIGEVLDAMGKQDMAFQNIPEVESVVGKLGRAESALDPAPTSMIETVINYKSEYITDRNGRRVNFRYDRSSGQFARDDRGELIPDPRGRPFRQWRDHIRTPDDIWDEILMAAEITGTTSAPRLQPIAARIVMLQSGMRAPMGVKVTGPSLEAIEDFARQIETHLKDVPTVMADAVVADRIVGTPYLEIVPDRNALKRYGVTIDAFQQVVEVAIGGRPVTRTVEGRERFPVRVRYPRELRSSVDDIDGILFSGSGGAQIPLAQLAEIRYVRGPQMIRSEDTFLTGYVLFDMLPGNAEVDVVEAARDHLQKMEEQGRLLRPRGVSYEFAGSYQNQVRASQRLMLILPLALLVIFLIIYLQFRRTTTTLLVFSGIAVAWAGGFIMLWLYDQPWFLEFSVFGVPMRTLFQVGTVNLSVAVWVGFLALFSIATDDGVVMGTYLEQVFREDRPRSISDIRKMVVLAGSRRVRACLMTTLTTTLALLPVMTSQGRGSDIMLPMAIPTFGGMTIAIITMLVVPVLYGWLQERKFRRSQ